ESGVPLRIVADGFEDGRMHHPRSADLEPSGLLAHVAAGAVALPAADVDFRARLRVRKETRAEAHPRFLAEHIAREHEERPLQIRQRNAFADDQPFHLREGWR